MRLPYRSALLLALFVATAAIAQSRPEHGDEVYQPSVGQPGKDVIWVPTPDALVTRMLQATKTTRDDLVYDLGSGDGKIPIAAAKEFGATAVGIEYNPEMADLARRNVKRAGVEGRVQIITGDIFNEDFSKATVVTMYLLPELNLKLRPIILNMKPGTRVISHQFNMGDWEADEILNVEYRNAYLWYVPAQIAGEWVIKEDSGGFEGLVTLSQRYQRVGGTITTGAKTQPLLSPTLNGDKLAFSFIDSENSLRMVRATVAGTMMRGDLSRYGRPTTLTGRRR